MEALVDKLIGWKELRGRLFARPPVAKGEEVTAAEPVTARESVAEAKPPHLTYRSVMVKCGKPGCKCAREELHGPYRYAYWTEHGKTRSKYIGKQAPAEQAEPVIQAEQDDQVAQTARADSTEQS